jgi:hypothetical protein
MLYFGWTPQASQFKGVHNDRVGKNLKLHLRSHRRSQ